MSVLGIMERFNPELFVAMATALSVVQRPRRFIDEEQIPNEIKDGALLSFSPMRGELENLGLIASLASLDKLIATLSSEDCTVGRLKILAGELEGRITDELCGYYFLSLTSSEAIRYEHWERGWSKILERFPEVTRDVEEMNKCFALGRYTASMFHALHVAEWGAISLGDFIGVSDHKKGWGPTVKELKKLVDGGSLKLPEHLNGNFDFIEQMNREITSMALAWRHKVDHAANSLSILPNTDFTPDIAEHVSGAVRIFMLRLLEGLPAQSV